ncbi:MAG: hypothetical protein KKE17_13595 [Proteobacteria bacterium]|nr:hypothetical protein [Pseudomonadota bacterium]MBU1711031.1 hypothetical protein [Pseudomonadota bacterium]
MGGLSKKAYQIKEIIKENTAPYLILDAGALLFKNERLNPGKQSQDEITATGIVAAYNAMNYDAVGISRHDLAAGLDFLINIRDRSQFPWLSANLVRISTNQPIFESSSIRKIGDLKVGIIGITENVTPGTFSKKDDAAILPWTQILPQLAEDLSQSCDMVILLSSLSATENLQITKELTNIHMILQAQPTSANLNPVQHANTLVFETANRGKYFGLLRFNWSASKAWGVDNTDSLLTLRQNLDRYAWQVKRFTSKGDPEEIFKTDPRRLSSYRNLVQKHDALADEINAIEKDIEYQKKKGLLFSTFANRFFPLDISMPDHKEVKEIVEETKKKVNEAGKNLAQNVSPQKNSEDQASFQSNNLYTGWKICAKCHDQQTLFWQKSKHRNAYQTLINQQQQYNLDCLPCHITPAYSGDVSNALKLPEEFLQVGCETCHGPGNRHSADPSGWPLQSIPGEIVCKRCHTPDRDEAFVYLNKMKLLGCSQAATQ